MCVKNQAERVMLQHLRRIKTRKLQEERLDIISGLISRQLQSNQVSDPLSQQEPTEGD